MHQLYEDGDAISANKMFVHLLWLGSNCTCLSCKTCFLSTCASQLLYLHQQLHVAASY